MNVVKPYDPADVDSIYDYAKKLLNKRLKEFCPTKLKDSPAESVKGRFGQFLEKYYFGIETNSESRPDFEEVGLELKTTPVKKTKNKGLVAKERLVLNIINYNTIVDETWDSSHFLSKNEFLLLIVYLYETDKSFLEFFIKYVALWKLEGADREIIRQDWETIVAKIRRGKAHELSEGDTFYLGACRKGWKERPVTYRTGKIPAKKRAFSFKQRYMNTILKRLREAEPLVKDPEALKTVRLEDVIAQRLEPFTGLAVKTIEKRLGVKLAESKNYFEVLARRMLGVTSKRVEEFEKADVTMKIIRLQTNNSPKESMSFPMFKFKEVVNQSWDESDFAEQVEKKFFFVVFQIQDDDSVEFRDAFFWTMPSEDIEEAKKVWMKTRRILKEGVKIEERNGKLYNNLPGSSENRVAHVRPHGRNRDDTDELPDGRRLTKQSFWLNNSYITDVVRTGRQQHQS